jgi:hypothetical protein
MRSRSIAGSTRTAKVPPSERRESPSSLDEVEPTRSSRRGVRPPRGSRDRGHRGAGKLPFCGRNGHFEPQERLFEGRVARPGSRPSRRHRGPARASAPRILRRWDPDWPRIHENDRIRLVRGIEVYLASGEDERAHEHPAETARGLPGYTYRASTGPRGAEGAGRGQGSRDVLEWPCRGGPRLLLRTAPGSRPSRPSVTAKCCSTSIARSMSTARDGSRPGDDPVRQTTDDVVPARAGSPMVRGLRRRRGRARAVLDCIRRAIPETESARTRSVPC